MVHDSEPLLLESKKVCVVGAGMAGLAAARELRREGHDLTVLEQSGGVGGQWLYDPRTDGVHSSSIYTSLRLISPRQTTGFADFPFFPKDGRDNRRFPGHREVHRYLTDFCDAFGVMEAVRLHTRVLRAAMTPTGQWEVRSVDLRGFDTDAFVDEVFDAVVVASGHYSQPRLPSIKGMEAWRRRQMHRHSYRVPETFRGEVVVVIGCGESGRDIAMEIRGVAKKVYLVAKSMEEVTPGLSKVLAKHSANLHLQLGVERLCEDGVVVRVRRRLRRRHRHRRLLHRVHLLVPVPGHGRSRHRRRQPRGAAVRARVPAVAGSVALRRHTQEGVRAPVLRGAGEMGGAGAVRQEDAAGGGRDASVREGVLPRQGDRRRAQEVHRRNRQNRPHGDEFGDKYCDFPRVERWKHELMVSSVHGMMDDLETFRDDYQDSDSIKDGVKEWHLSAQHQDAAATETVARLHEQKL